MSTKSSERLPTPVVHAVVPAGQEDPAAVPSRQLLRFAVVRPPESRQDYPHVIVGPFDVEPGTPFQRRMNRSGSTADAAAEARRFIAGDNYVGRSLRTKPETRRVLRALPGLLDLARHDDRAALVAALTELSAHWPFDGGDGDDGGVAALWDGMIAVAAAPDRPAQDVADLTDMLRIYEAITRARAWAAEQEPTGAPDRAAQPDPGGVVAALTGAPVLPSWRYPTPLPGSPADRGIRPVGVSDLLLITERLLGYRYAQLSYVENVLRSEKKERNFRRLDRVYDSYALSTEAVEESERDLQSTSRSELQSEVSQTATLDASLSTGVSISAAYGPFMSADTSIDASLGTSTESSTSMSESFAQDIVDRSVTRVSRSVTETAVQRVLAETEETSLHGFDNVAGTTDVVGYYRWLEEARQARVMNYGRRMIMEFMVPRPAAVWLAARGARPAATISASAPDPLDLHSPADLREDNYAGYVAVYQVTGVTPPPPALVYVTKAFEMAEREHEKSLGNNDFVVQTKQDFVQIPAGYTADYVWADESKESYGTGSQQLRVHVANRIINLTVGPREGDFAATTGPIEIAVFMYDFKAATVDLKLRCNRTVETFAAWQIATFEKIAAAYDTLLDAYNKQIAADESALADATSAQQAAQAGLSPDAKRAIEREELKRGALNLLTGEDFSSYSAVTGPTTAQPLPVIDVAEALVEGAQVRHHEQACEWINMTYVCYPYFWGDQDRWFDTLAEGDVDPVFQAFLRAGYARVQVPVRPGFEKSMLYYLATGEVWHGAEAPAIGDHFYLPIVEELAEAAGMSLSRPEPYGRPWTYFLPTTLVALGDVSDLGL